MLQNFRRPQRPPKTANPYFQNFCRPQSPQNLGNQPKFSNWEFNTKFENQAGFLPSGQEAVRELHAMESSKKEAEASCASVRSCSTNAMSMTDCYTFKLYGRKTKL